MIGRLLGRGAVEVSIETNKERFWPGESVVATITLEPKRTVLITKGESELVCLGYYAFLGHGLAMPAVYSRSSQAFLSNATLLRGERQQITVSFHIPPACPTYDGACITIQWWVRAKLQVAGRRTFLDFLPLGHRIIPEEAEATWMGAGVRGDGDSTMITVLQPQGESLGVRPSHEGKVCALSIDLSEQWAQEGSVVRGQLTVAPNKDIDVEAIETELILVEKFQSVPEQTAKATE